MTDERAIFHSDDGPAGDEPTLETFFGGNLDWYVRVAAAPRDRELCPVPQAVRFSTSGGRNPTATMLVAALDAAIRGEWGRVREVAEAAVRLAALEQKRDVKSNSQDEESS